MKWSKIWPMVRAADAAIPAKGRMRDAFTRAHERWAAEWIAAPYDQTLRTEFFGYAMRFGYGYPIRRGDTVVQVGASFGEETERLVGAVGKSGKVIAIEPEARNVEVMRRMVPLRTYPQLTIIQCAASDRTGEAEFLIGSGKQHRLAGLQNDAAYEFRGATRELLAEADYPACAKVRADTLDNILAPYALDRIDLLLVETNGSEYEVLAGAERTCEITRRIAARGHVQRHGQASAYLMDKMLKARGFSTRLTPEKMILARPAN